MDIVDGNCRVEIYIPGGAKKVRAFDLVQRKNYKRNIAEINVAVFIKV